MKAALLFCSLLSSTFGLSAGNSNEVDWSDIHAYIEAHAINGNVATEGALWAESVSGTKTWTVVGGGGSAARVDGIGVGWPKTRDVIEFSTTDEAVELAEMVDDFRESQLQSPEPESPGLESPQL